ncbi:hypothetical protein MY10362_009417 [Beauveria mimosiformis]
MPQDTAEKPVGASKPDNSLPPVDKDEAMSNAGGSTAPQREATFQDYLRLFKYANTWDFVAYAAGTAAAIGSGVTIPLLNVVFGKFTTQFSAYAGTQALADGEFQNQLSKISLYLLGLFLGRLILTYINKYGTKLLLEHKINELGAIVIRPHVKVLDDLSLTLEKGKVTALIGPSGCRKSTIVGLIKRWYNLKSQHIIPKTVEKRKENKGSDKGEEKTDNNDQELKQGSDADGNTGPPIELGGRISTCGHSLDNINVKWWRSQIGLVQEMVQAACEEALADEFMKKIEQGYDTSVGDSGAKLSGSQRQRITITRAII